MLLRRSIGLSLRGKHLLLGVGITGWGGVRLTLRVSELRVRCRRELVWGRLLDSVTEIEGRRSGRALRDGDGNGSGWCRHPDRWSRGCGPHGLKTSAEGYGLGLALLRDLLSQKRLGLLIALLEGQDLLFLSFPNFPAFGVELCLQVCQRVLLSGTACT